MADNDNPFPKVICLTLPQQRRRQLLLVQEFKKAGISNYEFFPGFTKDSDAVKQAYTEGKVKRYPNCFRCGKRDCGNPDCNNILLPVQVAVTLGFKSIFKIIANGSEPFVAICEDDIFFAPYAKKLLRSAQFSQKIKESGLPTNTPALLRLTHPGVDKNFFSENIPSNLDLTDKVTMSNPFFVVNQSFARLACERLNWIDSTADIIIHDDVTLRTHCMTLNIQLVIDRSWSLGELPSLIHPTRKHLNFLHEKKGKDDPSALVEAKRIQRHVKKAVCRPYCFIGSPRCGSHFVSAFLQKNGLDIGHEYLGGDGIASWQFTVSSESYPYIQDNQVTSDFFSHFDTLFIYSRNPINAIPSLIIENQKAPLSYAFRRKKIDLSLGVNLDEFVSPIEKAARSYAHWYQIALMRNYKAILRVESFLDDCRQHLPSHKFANIEVSPKERGAGKPYLGVQHSPSPLPADWKEGLSSDSLKILSDVANRLGYNI